MNEVQTSNYDISDCFNKAVTDEEILIELCDQIKNDDGWREVKGGFIKDYFENASSSKLPILKRYESYFEAAGFKYQAGYVEKNFFLSAKFKDYQARAYELKGIIFIYASYNPSIETSMKSTAGELSKILMPELNKLKEKISNINSAEKDYKKPLEILMLKFPKQD